MNISWYGQTCFKITYQRGKNSAADILIDPFGKETGLKPPKKETDILISKNRDSQSKAFLIEGPGEYDVYGAYIRGFSIGGNENIVYTIEAEDVKICHLGKFLNGEISSEQLEEIGDIDILLVPIGGIDVLDSKSAVKIMSQIEPRITIPMNYKLPGLKTKHEGVDVFLKALGIKSLPAMPKLSIKKKDIPQEEAKIIVLEP